MKSIAIVGAGPAGLVTAKTLLRSYPQGSVSVTVLEASDRLGGLWPVDKDDVNGLINPEMPTNLSRFTVSFSDLSWKSVSLGDDAVGASQHLESSNSYLPLFPKAWHVGRYLEAYARKFLPEGTIKLRSRVTRAERVSIKGDYKWRLLWAKPDVETLKREQAGSNGSDGTEGCNNGVFDYLVVASGFFSSPRPLDILASSPEPEPSPIKVVHSSRFRNISELLPSWPDVEGKVVVVGGGISGAEAAASAAFQTSDAEHRPSKTGKRPRLKVYHVLSRPIYSLPVFLPRNPNGSSPGTFNPVPEFAPLDVCLYDLGRRPEGPVKPSNGLMPARNALKSHAFIRSVIGGDQSDLDSPGLVHSSEEMERPAYVALTDNYAEFVRSGDIVPVRGRVIEMLPCSSKTGQASIKVASMARELGGDQNTTTIDGVVGVVHANGFTPHTALDWIEESVRESLRYDEASNRLPVLLQPNSIWNTKVPAMAFVGFYEGPFWGVMEMQARMIAQRWTQKIAEPDTSSPDANTIHETQDANAYVEEMAELRKAMAEKADNVPQFWMGDYVGLMEGMATELKLERNDDGWGHRQGPVVGARYLDEQSDIEGAQTILEELRGLNHLITNQAKLVARAAFRAMQGPWSIHRKLQSFIPGFPSGSFDGTASFHPRCPTNPDYDAEYLYMESGELRTDSGLTLQANKRYVYRYKESTDKISAWFVKEDGLTVDYFFNQMSFEVSTGQDHARGWVAKGEHLCGRDLYNSICEFRFRGAALDTFRIDYVVKGPKKDQVLETWYKR